MQALSELVKIESGVVSSDTTNYRIEIAHALPSTPQPSRGYLQWVKEGCVEVANSLE